jgi:hypothetical protein
VKWTALIVFPMARATYRRRSDGVLEILRPSVWRRLGGAMTVKTAATALLLVLAGTAGVGLYSVFGIAFVLLLASFGLTGALWQRGKAAQRAPAQIRSVGARRTVAP